MHRVRPRVLLVALNVVLGVVCAALLAGCGSAPESSEPTGVDGLEVPTTSPRPQDFVDGVDNPLLALEPGTVWTYAVDDPAPTDASDEELTLTIGVPGRTRTVAGIDATVVEETLIDGSGVVLERGERWLAQDVDGNVWLLGTSASPVGGLSAGGSWEAGVAGAQAGLVMPAEPRVGDGFRVGRAPGIFDARVRIVDVDASVTVPAGGFSGALEAEVTSGEAGERTSTTWYAAGTGLLAEQDVTGGVRGIELVSVERP